MIKTGKMFLLAVLAVGLSSSPLLAGDDNGGAKRNPIILVENDYDFPVGVIIDANEDDLRDARDDTNPQQAFEDLGGVFLNQGETASFEVRAGAHDVFVVDTVGFTTENINAAEASINVDRGETQRLFVIGFRESIALVVSGVDVND